MYISALGTATPPARYTKAQCWESFRASTWFERLSPRSRAITRTVLMGNNGIETRHLALERVEDAFAIDADTLTRRFATAAPELAARAASRALARASLRPHEIDAIVVSTCTGYLCPGLSGYVAERLGLRDDIAAFDLVGQGCGAALPTLDLACALLARERAKRVLAVCVEVSSAAMYLDDDPGVLVSACLFGDGAGAAIISAVPPETGRRVTITTIRSKHVPAARESLRFRTERGMLRNVLTREVPQLAAVHARGVLQETLAEHGLAPESIAAWIVHAAGRDVLEALRRELVLAPEALAHSSAVLREYGNLSSASVLFVLEAALADSLSADGWWWMTSFGAGFACHGTLLRVQ